MALNASGCCSSRDSHVADRTFEAGRAIGDDLKDIEVIIAADGEEARLQLPLTNFMMKQEMQRPNLERFHFDYIGHSLGKDGLKGAVDRLVGSSGKRKAHEHLREILVELNSLHLDQEAFVALFSFAEQRRVVTGGATSFDPIHSFDEDPERIWRFIDTRVPRDVRIKLDEAALVNHFKPRFNSHHKVCFATSQYRVLDFVSTIDFTATSIHFDTQWLGAELDSETV